MLLVCLWRVATPTHPILTFTSMATLSSCEFMFVSAKDSVVAKATLEQIKSCGYARNVLRRSRLAGLLSCVNSTLLTGSSYVGFQ